MEKTPVVYISERHESAECDVAQRRVLAALAERVPPSKTLLVMEGTNPCMEELMRQDKGHTILNEYLQPSLQDVNAFFNFYWKNEGPQETMHPLNWDLMKRLFDKIPDGAGKLAKFYANQSKYTYAARFHPEFYEEKLSWYRELAAAVEDPELKEIIENVIITEPTADIAEWSGGRVSPTAERLLALRDRRLIQCVEAYVAENRPAIVVIIRGGYHKPVTMGLIEASPILKIDHDRSFNYYGGRRSSSRKVRRCSKRFRSRKYKN